MIWQDCKCVVYFPLHASSRFLIALHCGGRTELGSPQPDASFDSVVMRWCGPADQSAVFFRFDPVATCELSGTLTVSGTGFVFYGPTLPNAPGDYAVGDGSSASTSGGFWCAAPQSCVTATSGTLTITEMTSTFATGSYVLVLPGNMTKTGTFTATVCNNAITCG